MSLPPPRQSWLDVLATLPAKERAAALRNAAKALDQVDVGDKESVLAITLERLRREWRWIARREQLEPPGDWAIWLIRTGRGWGKNAAGAHWLIEQHRQGCRLSGVVGRTEEDVKRYCLRGESGILSVAPAGFQPKLKAQSLRWPAAGEAPYPAGETLLFFSKNPDAIRGPNLERAWCDELAGWLQPQQCWDNLRFTMRSGTSPRIVVTTTPKPIAVIRKLTEDAKRRPDRVILTTGSTYENAANLAPGYLEEMRDGYEGTRLGRQELYGEVLMQAAGALWDWGWFERPGFRLEQPECELERVGVAIDPAATSTEDSSETGIVKGGRGEDKRGYLLGDLSGRYTPSAWARQAIFAYFGFSDGIPANAIIAERNNGGEMVKHTIVTEARELKRRGEIPTDNIPVRVVWASHGKAARAEPVSTRYESGRVSHCGQFPQLEYQLTAWEPNSGMRSPDRLDALVWLMTWALDTARSAEWTPDEISTVGPLTSAAPGLYDEIDRLREEYPL